MCASCAYFNKNTFTSQDAMRFMKNRYFIILYTNLVFKTCIFKPVYRIVGVAHWLFLWTACDQ